MNTIYNFKKHNVKIPCAHWILSQFFSVPLNYVTALCQHHIFNYPESYVLI